MNNKRAFLKNKKVLMAFSVLTSIVIWLVVSTVLKPISETTVSDVGVNINVQSGILGEMGLSAIEGGESTVDVVISGSRSVIGGVTAEDISVTPSLSGVSGAGIYMLELTAKNNSGKDFSVISISPSTIYVKFDKLISKTLKVNYMVTGDYNVPDEYIQNPIYVQPSEIVVEGPENDLLNISAAKVSVELKGDHTETVAIESNVLLTDSEGNTLEYNKDEITLSDGKATVFIPIHETKEYPFSFKYVKVPQNFDVSTLKYDFSDENVLVEGEKSTVEKYNDLFLGYIDISCISLDNSAFDFNVSFPNGIESVDNFEKVTVSFDLADYAEATFNVNQIMLINSPANYTAKSNVSKIAVKIVGTKEVIDSISAKDIIAEVDMGSRDFSQTGQYKMPVNVFLEEGINAWAIGEYYVTVTIKE